MNRVYIIAEAGVNHNGNIDLAIDLIHAAKKAGADCVKFQTYKTEEIVTIKAPKADYQLKVTDKEESQFAMLKKLELSKSDFAVLKKECESIGIDFMSTPYSFSDLELLDALGVSQFKIASGQLTELDFLRAVAKKNKRIILSTGMGTMSEVFEAVSVIKEIQDDLIVLQCTTNYPSDIGESNIHAMNSMKVACKVRVGYSDHVVENYACYAAVALGAEVIEKHFTLDKRMKGPDHSCSLDPKEFKELVAGIRKVEVSLGDGVKVPSENEVRNTFGMRRGIVTARALQKGEIIDLAMVGFKRPMTGILPKQLNDILGKKVSRDLEADAPITLADIQW